MRMTKTCSIYHSSIYKPLFLILAVYLMAASAVWAVQYQYDREQQLIRATYPNGQQINYTYDAAGNLLTETATGTDTRGSVRVQVSPPTASWSFTDSMGAVHSATGNHTVANIPLGRVDIFWQPLTAMIPPSVNPDGHMLVSGTLTIQGAYGIPPTDSRTWWLYE